ncbi:MAG: putative sulfate exporter family transporter [Actinomycetota bacterium]
MPMPSATAVLGAPPRTLLPGITAVVVLTVVASVVHELASTVSALLIGVVLGAVVGNAGLVSPTLQPGFTFAAKRLLRVGIVLLGLRLSLSDITDLGALTLVVVVATVAATFFGTQAMATRMGLSRDLGLLVATGYSICGASAIAAVESATDATEDEVAISIGLVTLCGTIAMLTIPPLGDALGLSDEQLGTWIGAGIHDVGQVAAAGSIAGAAALSVAVVVKLTRVSLLAVIVTYVNINRRRHTSTDAAANDTGTRPPLVPAFVAGFLAMVVLRTTDVLSDDIITSAKTLEGWLLTAALVGLGAGVRFERLRRLGPKPLLLGLGAWVVVAGVSLTATMGLL